MDKKKTKKISIIAAAVLVVAGAAGGIYYFANRDKISDLATETYAEIVSEKKLPDKEYTNLDFSEAVLNVPSADKLYKYYTHAGEPYTKEQCTQICYELFDMFITPMYPEGEEIVYTDIKTNPLPEGEAEYTNNVTGDLAMAGLWCGFDEGYYEFSGTRLALNGIDIDVGGRFIIDADDGKPHGTEFEKVIRLDRGGELPDETYSLKGEDYSTKQAMQFANETLEKLAPYLNNAQLTPTEFIIMKNMDNDDYQYEIQFAYVLDDMPVFHLMPPVDNSANGEVLSLTNHMLYITIDTPDHITRLDTGYPIGESVKKGDEFEDKYISLEKAADLASEYLAPYYMNKISEVSVTYVDMFWYKPGEYDLKEAESTPMTPCWCLISDLDEDDYSYARSCNAIYIDMQTGEVLAYDPVYEGYKSSTKNAVESEKLL